MGQVSIKRKTLQRVVCLQVAESSVGKMRHKINHKTWGRKHQSQKRNSNKTHRASAKEVHSTSWFCSFRKGDKIQAEFQQSKTAKVQSSSKESEILKYLCFHLSSFAWNHTGGVTCTLYPSHCILSIWKAGPQLIQLWGHSPNSYPALVQ